MRDHLYLFVFMIHFSTGCILSDEGQVTVMTAYTGASVLLPCSCADPRSTADTFTWRFQSGGRWTEVFEDEKYRGRRELFNEGSPRNLSLLISGLRTEDQGDYTCTTKQHTTIRLTVKGCNLAQNRESGTEVTGYSGESVVLPCSCSELLAKPEQIRWTYYLVNNYKEIYPNEEIDLHKNRVKLLNQTTPGNLSLHISALTVLHGGVYICSVSSEQYSSYTLHVKEKPHIQTDGLSTHQPSHQTRELTHQPSHQTRERASSPSPPSPQHTHQYVFIMLGVILSVPLLVFIYWRCRGGRNVKKKKTSDDEELRKQDDQDDLYSTVVYVRTASTPAHTSYAPIKVKR
ncbi:uncharacterized protein [Pseudorasbora parva]|uniref:uncharacterized protein n=1 Tax=Pseudorasbora parva TaxID=51549 RepID=UPI00351E5054